MVRIVLVTDSPLPCTVDHIAKIGRSRGHQVIVVDSRSAANSALRALRRRNCGLVLHWFTDKTDRVDYCTLIIDGKVTEAVRRRGSSGTTDSGRTRINYESVRSDTTESDISSSAANTLNLSVASVTLIPTALGPVFSDVSPLPRFEWWDCHNRQSTAALYGLIERGTDRNQAD